MKRIIISIIAMTMLNAKTQDSSPHTFSFTLRTHAPSSVIWETWTDVDRWHEWDLGLKEASLEGKFELGAKGKLVPDKGPRAKFKIVSLQEGRSYAFRTGLPLGSLEVERYLEQKGHELEFTHKVKFKGLTKGIFAKSFGKRYQELLPKVLNKIKSIAETSSYTH